MTAPIEDRPVILGYDAVTCLGPDVDTTWHDMLEGKSGITRLDPPEDSAHFPIKVAGRVRGPDLGTYPFFTPKELRHWASPVIRHAMLTAYRALEMAGIDIDQNLASRTAVTYSSAVGGLDQFIRADRELVAKAKLPRPLMNPNACINMVTGKVSILAGATGPIVTPVGACATGSLSLATGAMLIEQGMADLALCGASDFALVEVIMAGFDTMKGSFRPKPEGDRADRDPGMASRPFSKDRRGFVVSEGAAGLVLASPKLARSMGLKPLARIRGIGMTSDAFHYVAPNLPTVAEAMRKAVLSAEISPSEIDVVNAHAASTKTGDQVEAEALAEIFGKDMPPVTANKAQLGHAMGAASAIEAIMAIKGMQTGLVPPTINYEPDPDTPVPNLVLEKTELDHSLVLHNSFGFGGVNCCLVLERMDP